ncbi:MAG: FAD-dependent oxidoreductase [Thermomicrobiales bacterium]|nr:FAD-dependent oxidoreductase [Thermomicrobiales bacterium]
MSERVQVAIVGGGPAGLSAAIEAANAGARVTLFDENPSAGGQLRYRLGDIAGPDGVTTLPPRLAAAMARQAADAGVEIRTGSRVWGIFAGNAIGVERDGVSSTVEAERILLATGSVDRSLPFPGGSLPGVFTARAVQILLNVHLVRPGRRFAIIADEPQASELTREILLAGGEVVVTLPAAAGDFSASGDDGVARFSGGGIERDVDVVVVAAGRQADAGLALMAECEAGYSEAFAGFVPKLDETLQTSISGLFAAGDCAGPCSADIALAEGAYAGVCLAASLDLVTPAQLDDARSRYLAATGERAALLASVPGGFVQVDRVPMGVTTE